MSYNVIMACRGACVKSVLAGGRHEIVISDLRLPIARSAIGKPRALRCQMGR
jgi:hypothetical protein